MAGTVGAAPLPPLPYRARPAQVLLAVGAVLVVSAGAAVASAYGGGPVRLVLLALAGITAACSLRAGRSGLRSSAETLAACTAGLALAGSALGTSAPGVGPATVAALSAAFLLLHRAGPGTAAWPLASWAAAQLAVLRSLDEVPAVLRDEAVLVVALAGLCVALSARPVVARLVMATTAPWWAAGVLAGLGTAWGGSGAQPWVAAALTGAAAAGLLAARLRKPLDVLLGPPRAVPVVAGAATGAALAGAASSAGPAAVTTAGYLGVLTVSLAATTLTGWRRGLFLPVALSGAALLVALSVARLAGGGHWGELSVLLLLTALPTVAVAVRRPDDRPVAVPTAVGCLAGATLLALPDRLLSTVAAAVVLTVVYAAAMVVGAGLAPSARRTTARSAAFCAVAATALLRFDGDRRTLAALLAVQGAFTLSWAWRTGRGRVPEQPADPTSVTAWRAGALQLVLACWFLAAAAGLTAVEWYSLPAAAGLLVAAGRDLADGPSWPAWGPGLLVAAVPSAVLAVTTSDGARAVGVLLTAAAVLVVAARAGVRAPLEVGAGTVVALAVGVMVRALPWPLAAALLVGAVLLAVGMRREQTSVTGFATRLADLR